MWRKLALIIAAAPQAWGNFEIFEKIFAYSSLDDSEKGISGFNRTKQEILNLLAPEDKEKAGPKIEEEKAPEKLPQNVFETTNDLFNNFEEESNLWNFEEDSESLNPVGFSFNPKETLLEPQEKISKHASSPEKAEVDEKTPLGETSETLPSAEGILPAFEGLSITPQEHKPSSQSVLGEASQKTPLPGDQLLALYDQFEGFLIEKLAHKPHELLGGKSLGAFDPQEGAVPEHDSLEDIRAFYEAEVYRDLANQYYKCIIDFLDFCKCLTCTPNALAQKKNEIYELYLKRNKKIEINYTETIDIFLKIKKDIWENHGVQKKEDEGKSIGTFLDEDEGLSTGFTSNESMEKDFGEFIKGSDDSKHIFNEEQQKEKSGEITRKSEKSVLSPDLQELCKKNNTPEGYKALVARARNPRSRGGKVPTKADVACFKDALKFCYDPVPSHEEWKEFVETRWNKEEGEKEPFCWKDKEYDYDIGEEILTRAMVKHALRWLSKAYTKTMEKDLVEREKFIRKIKDLPEKEALPIPKEFKTKKYRIKASQKEDFGGNL